MAQKYKSKDARRKSLRTQLLWIVMGITISSMLILSIITEICFMFMLRTNSEITKSKLIDDLTEIVDGRTMIVDSMLGEYAAQTSDAAQALHELYLHEENYKPRQIDYPLAENGGVYTMQKNYLNENIDLDAIRQEEELLANIEDTFAAIMQTNEQSINGIYCCAESGFTFCYDSTSDKKAGMTTYNYMETDYYKLAREEQKLCFTDVYEDGFGRGLTITCTAPFYNAENEFAGVVAMDILIADLYDMISTVNIESAEVLLVDRNGRLISEAADGGSLFDEDTLDSETASSIISGRHANAYIESTGYYYFFAPIKQTDWRFCIGMAEDNMLVVIDRMTTTMVMTNLLYIIAAVNIIMILAVIVDRFSRRITEPVVMLGKDAEIISRGNLDHRTVAYENNEIGDLAKIFNQMAESLKAYMEDIRSVTAEKERISTELNVATQIQLDMLPTIFPPFPDRVEFDIYAKMDAAKEVGGDFYDFFFVDEDHLALVMADVSGKGVPAALFMVIAKTLIKNRALVGDTDPSGILHDVNNQLCEGNEAELFVTVWLCIINLKTGSAIEANAGHEHPVIRHSGGSYELVVNRHSPAIATIEGIRFREYEFQIEPGDAIFVYTDGVPEATNAENELYGTDRMLEVLNRQEYENIEEMLKELRADIDKFVGKAPQFDDITMLGFNYYGPEGKAK